MRYHSTQQVELVSGATTQHELVVVLSDFPLVPFGADVQLSQGNQDQQRTLLQSIPACRNLSGSLLRACAASLMASMTFSVAV
jgi:hypothetical protein